MAKTFLFVDAFNLTARLRYVYWPEGIILDPSDFRLVSRFIYSLSLLVQEMQPSRVILTPDPERYERSSFFPEYKAQRESCPIYNHHKALCVLLTKKTLPVNVVSIPGYEADDIIARYCEELEGKKIIVTTDNDLLQVVQNCPDTWLYNPIKKEYIDIPHSDVSCIQLKALMGDRGDNIPSVTGEVTALKMLRGEKNLNEWLDGGTTRTENMPRREVFERNRQLVALLGEHALLPKPELPSLDMPPMNLKQLRHLAEEKLDLDEWTESESFSKVLSIWKTWYRLRQPNRMVIPRGKKVQEAISH